MTAVLFEWEPRRGAANRCFEMAATLKAELATMDGFLSVERFESLAKPGRLLSLGLCRDENSVRAWRCRGMNRRAQQQGRSDGLAGDRLRVATPVRDDGLQQRDEAPSGSPSALI